MEAKIKAMPAINKAAAKKALPNVKIFLIGLMGSGKSYWADVLKKKCKVAAYDLDNLVEVMGEKTIAEMFAEDGEDVFRKAEAKMLRLFKEKKQFILSVGGGTPCFHDNMEWMNKQGITIWIDEPIEVLTKRLLSEQEHRPLIKALRPDELPKFLQHQLDQRQVYYSLASYRLNGNNINEQSLLNIIKQHV